MEIKNPPRPWLGVAVVGKVRDLAGGFVGEGQRGVVQVLEFGGPVSFRLFLDGGKRLRFVRRLGFYQPDGLLADEQDIIRPSPGCLVLPYGNTWPSRPVEHVLILHAPSCFGEHRVNAVPSGLFWVLVAGHVG